MTIRTLITTPAVENPVGEYAMAPDVVLALLDDGSGRLLDLAGRFYALSPTGATMLAETLQVGEAATAGRIAARHGMAAAVVRADLRRFLGDLEKQHLVGRNGRTRSPSRGRVAALFLRPMLRIAGLLPPLSRAKAHVLLAVAYCSVRWFGWANTTAAWLRALGDPSRGRAADSEAASAAADAAVRAAAARHLLHVECKERAIACWSMLRAHGVPARLVVGVDLFPFASHCWCAYGDRVLTDFPDRCERFTPVKYYG